MSTPTTHCSRFLAPVRFDIHQVDGFERWVREHGLPGALLVVDMSAVAFIDLAAVASLLRAQRRVEGICRFGVEALSVAARLTFELLEHQVEAGIAGFLAEAA